MEEGRVEVKVTFSFDMSECGGDEVKEKIEKLRYQMKQFVDERTVDLKDFVLEEAPGLKYK